MYAMIYIVEDDKNISEIESFALKNSGYEVAVYESAGAFEQAVKERMPRLVLLDIMLPDESGLTVVDKLRRDPLTEKIPIILVTAKTSELDKVKGFDLGADDYITKPFGVMELISRVKALLRRSGEQQAEKCLCIGNLLLDDERHTVTVEGGHCELTYKEYELLKLLMQRAGIVTRREDILNHVWGTSFQGESRTLDMHIKTLRQKLGPAGEMVKTVRGVGYMLENNGMSGERDARI
ncbi:MAG: response regulator transcription factor [Lachnospiraceae bacterium]|nr:response regulator transcription factor [Lachnospiraceae bacterium]